MSFASFFNRKGSNKKGSKKNKCEIRADVDAEQPGREAVATVECKESEKSAEASHLLRPNSADEATIEKLNGDIWNDVKKILLKQNIDDASNENSQNNCDNDRSISEIQKEFGLEDDLTHEHCPQSNESLPGNEKQEFVSDSLRAEYSSCRTSEQTEIGHNTVTQSSQIYGDCDENKGAPRVDSERNESVLKNGRYETIHPKRENMECENDEDLPNCDLKGVLQKTSNSNELDLQKNVNGGANYISEQNTTADEAGLLRKECENIETTGKCSSEQLSVKTNLEVSGNGDQVKEIQGEEIREMSKVSVSGNGICEQKDDGFEEPHGKEVLKTFLLEEYIEDGKEFTEVVSRTHAVNSNPVTRDAENGAEDPGERINEDLLLSEEKPFLSSESVDPSSEGIMLSEDDGLSGGKSVVPHDVPTMPSWKVGYLQVKLPNKSKNRGKFKVWHRRWMVIHVDEFVKDTSDRSLMVSVYLSESGTSRKHSALFWKAVAAHHTVVYRSHSRTHKFAFSISEDSEVVLHLAATSETEAQEWMTAMRCLLWPPNPVLQIQKMLNGNEFEVSVIDNEFSYHAGLLGAYGILSVTPRKLILVHPQSEHVVQEWYLNTIDKFELSPHVKEEDAHKVVTMHTGSDSSTGSGQIKFYCQDSVALLQSIASTIHKVLSLPSNVEKEMYRQEMEQLAAWITSPESTPPGEESGEDYYKVPRRLVRSLLDIPNFLFDKPIPCEENLPEIPPIKHSLSKISTWVSTFSEDSGISLAPLADDFLNCSVTSFTIGGRKVLDNSGSDSSDTYSPPGSPEVERKSQKEVAKA